MLFYQCYHSVHEKSIPQKRMCCSDEKGFGLTPNSLTSREALDCELAQVRERGYATNFEESDPDVSAISAAIHDPLSSFRASLTVSAPSTRLHEDVIEHIAKATIRSASQISTRI
jgi:DNA-binding IclR family transcriptional regulator